MKYSGKNTHEFPAAEEQFQKRIWQGCQHAEPRNTEKNIARRLGGNLSHRTVEGWRYRLPSTKNLLRLMLVLGPKFRAFIMESVDATAARTQEIDAEVLEIAERLKGLFEPEE